MSAFTVEDQERQRDEQNDRWKMLKSGTWGCAKVWEDLLDAPDVLKPLHFGNLPYRFNYATKLKCSVWNKPVLEHLKVQAVTGLPSLCHILSW